MNKLTQRLMNLVVVDTLIDLDLHKLPTLEYSLMYTRTIPDLSYLGRSLHSLCNIAVGQRLGVHTDIDNYSIQIQEHIGRSYLLIVEHMFLSEDSNIDPEWDRRTYSADTESFALAAYSQDLAE